MEALASSAKPTLGYSKLRLHNFISLPLSSPPTLTLKPNSYFVAKTSQNGPSCPIIRCCSSFTAKPSSEPTTQFTDSSEDDHNAFKLQANTESESPNGSTLLFPQGFKHWLVNVDVPSNGFASEARAVDFYVDILTKVLGNERDAQMCLYHVDWQPNFGFCCVLDEESADELTGVPGVLSVHSDEQFGSETKDYGGSRSLSNAPNSAQTEEISKTKLFITGLSFYTSEKTLHSAFEPFGEIMEVKVIMDKLSKRSKGYAFVKYTTEDATTTALQEMNGKIINGWMIVVDRAKSKPKYSRGRQQSMSLRDRKLT